MDSRPGCPGADVWCLPPLVDPRRESVGAAVEALLASGATKPLRLEAVACSEVQ